ncbi:MAG TPA: hypothetical protein PLN94_06480 [Thiolinea sp.]|nr:hypothetical protein [Thiolinea sp.]
MKKVIVGVGLGLVAASQAQAWSGGIEDMRTMQANEQGPIVRVTNVRVDGWRGSRYHQPVGNCNSAGVCDNGWRVLERPGLHCRPTHPQQMVRVSGGCGSTTTVNRQQLIQQQQLQLQARQRKQALLQAQRQRAARLEALKRQQVAQMRRQAALKQQQLQQQKRLAAQRQQQQRQRQLQIAARKRQLLLQQQRAAALKRQQQVSCNCNPVVRVQPQRPAVQYRPAPQPQRVVVQQQRPVPYYQPEPQNIVISSRHLPSVRAGVLPSRHRTARWWRRSHPSRRWHPAGNGVQA